MNQWSTNPLALPLRVSGVVFVLTLAVSLSILSHSLLLVVPIAAAVLFWVVFRHPTVALAAILAFMPIDFMAIALGKFVGFPHMTLVSVCTKEIPLLLIAGILCLRNGFKPAAPDWFLLACFLLACVRTMFDGTLVGLVTDFNFIVPYLVGRMTVITQQQEQLWARCAVWIAGALSMLGLIEVFVWGEGPRTLLYLAIDSETEGDQLASSFHAMGFSGLREAAGMIGPNGFGALCMVALIVWWVYCRNPIPAAMIGTGLVCSVTRSAWAGTAVAIPLVAILMGQTKRFFLYATLALALFAAAIPVLDLSDFLLFSKTGQDPSAEGHQEQIARGLTYAADHPFGAGNSKLSPTGFKQQGNVTLFETTYPYVASAYGIVVALCFVGFLASAGHRLWRVQSQLGHTALGILVGMSVVMIFTLPLIDRRLGCWAWFPIGLAIRSGIDTARVTRLPQRQTIMENP
jgi:hypothetical protein